jgi:Zn-dependent protease with chaperone function
MLQTVAKTETRTKTPSTFDSRSVQSALDVQIPVAKPGAAFPVEELRDPKESFYLGFVWAANFIGLGGFLLLLILVPRLISVILPYLILVGLFAICVWISWKLTYAFIYGNSIEVSQNQHPQIHKVVVQACHYLEIEKPTVVILQGHGLFEMLVAKKFTRRGLIVITSNMLDEFASKPSSRELMMYVGRQLGHIKAGHFRHWFLKDVVGRLAIFFHSAWQRRCQYTADRIGLLAAGDLYAAEQALLIITAGAKIAPGTNFDSILEQRTKLFESTWTWIKLAFSSYPYMIDRIVQLRKFAAEIGMRAPNARAFPIDHSTIRTLPILIIHGHDQVALLELKDLLHTNFPNVALRVMMTDHFGTLSMPEKFEKISVDIRGAIALVTPDDVGAALNRYEMTNARARQNVIMEIGFIWGRLGRDRCMLMMRGDLELPSDLSGIDFQKFERSPRECAFELHTFLDHIIHRFED